MSPVHYSRKQPGMQQAGEMPFSALQPVSLVECPRDAMQGWPTIIPTEKKVEYLNALLRVGFHTLDFGSFVSAKAIPQMADTAAVLDGLQLPSPSKTTGDPATRLLAIVANFRGAETAAEFDAIQYLGFPFSVSDTFQLRNANKTVSGSLATVEEIQELCVKRQKELVVYLSMGFGNPYGDPWSEEIVFEWAETISRLGVRILSIADTVGLATPEQVFSVTDYLIRQLSECTIGVHLHSTHAHWQAKIDAALQAGCRRFDGALKGIGGCPMAGDHLVGNMDTTLLIPYFERLGMLGDKLNQDALNQSLELAHEIFTN